MAFGRDGVGETAGGAWSASTARAIVGTRQKMIVEGFMVGGYGEMREGDGRCLVYIYRRRYGVNNARLSESPNVVWAKLVRKNPPQQSESRPTE